MHFHIITLFPEVCRAYTDAGVLGRAQKTEKGKGAKVRGKRIEVSYYNPRDFADNLHGKVDDRPYGGGPGMVIEAEPVLKAWSKAVGRKRGAGRKERGVKNNIKTLIMSPRGRVFDQKMARELAAECTHLVLISGRYEGIDARVKEALGAEEISIGNFVLSGGELPALTILDAVARQVPGVLGRAESLEESRTAAGEMYTRPESLRFRNETYRVPDVLTGGNHAEIESWRKGE